MLGAGQDAPRTMVVAVGEGPPGGVWGRAHRVGSGVAIFAFSPDTGHQARLASPAEFPAMPSPSGYGSTGCRIPLGTNCKRLRVM